MRARSSFLRYISALLFGMALVLAGTAVQPGQAGAQSGNPYERGPAPTASSIRSNGSFSVSTSSVGFGASGFGGGTVYYPTTTSQGTFGGVVIAPGFTATSSQYASLARRIASHGFVVLAMNTNSTFDFPPSRGTQILAALDWLTGSSSVSSRVDSSRLAASGHSMGGGGTLEAANSRSSLKAAVGLQPWHSDKTWQGIQVPTMIIGAESDTVASVSAHSLPFYNSIPSSTEKAFVELNGASHFAGNSNPADQGAAMLTWLKRYVDDDERYLPFLCPPPSSSDYSEWEDSYSCEGGGGTTTTGPGGGQCFTATNSAHRDAGRAEGFFFLTAVGSGDSLGLWTSETSLQQTAPGTWSLVDSC